MRLNSYFGHDVVSKMSSEAFLMSSAKVPKPFGESVNTKAFPRRPLCFLSPASDWPQNGTDSCSKMKTQLWYTGANQL